MIENVAIKNFLLKYDKVFDENGKVKLCGRDACMDLIISCHSIEKQTVGYFGNIVTGMMNIDNIKNLRLSINQSGEIFSNG